MDGIILSQNHR